MEKMSRVSFSETLEQIDLPSIKHHTSIDASLMNQAKTLLQEKGTSPLKDSKL